ncbi:MAG: site-specific integrase [Chloroflexi bacterium]|nr:site-specific integrase [Chloroflexota bacterium]
MRGSIQKQSKDSWRLFIDTGRDENGKRRRKTVTVQGGKSDAQRKLRELLSAVDNGIPITLAKQTLAEYLQDWLQRKESKVSPKTILDYEGIIRRYLTPRLGHIPIGKLTPHHVEELHSYMAGEGLSARSVQYAHRVLSQALKHAVRMEMLGRNVCDVVDVPSIRRKEMRVMDTDEVQTFLNVTQESPLWPVFFLAIYTGLRKGELLGLRWRDVDLSKATISVNQTAIRIKGNGVVISEPKTAYSRRMISLPASATRLLIDLKLKRKSECESHNLEWDESSLVLCNSVGEPLSPDTVTHTFSRALESAGLPHMRFHDLRHTHATLMLKEGVHPKVVSERLGHASINITLDIYSHVLPGMQEMAAEAFEQALGNKVLEPVGHENVTLL